MPQILFKRQFISAIRCGEKTTTLRRWKSCRLSAGSRAFAPGVGWLKILSCREINLKDLTAGDAQADGFASLSELLSALRQIYPNHKTDGRCWYRVVFQPENQQPPPPREGLALAQDPRKRLARQIRADLDKAVRQSGSLFPL
jgi:hypothetical protein